MNDRANPGPAGDRAAAVFRELRRKRIRRLTIAFSVGVGLPTLLAVVYYGFLASPQYESVAVVTIESGESEDGADGGFRLKGGGAVGRDLRLVLEHLRSRSVVEEIASKHGLVEHYRDRGIDGWSRLDDDEGLEGAHEYWLGKITLAHDSKAMTVTLGVRAFSPERARDFAGAAVASATRLFDRLSRRTRRDLVGAAEKRLATARRELARTRAAGPAADGPDAGAAEAPLDLELSREDVAAALRGVELARIEAARQSRRLAVIAEPSLADRPCLPRRLWSIASVFVTAFALVSVLLLLGAAVREHAKH